MATKVLPRSFAGLHLQGCRGLPALPNSPKGVRLGRPRGRADGHEIDNLDWESERIGKHHSCQKLVT